MSKIKKIMALVMSSVMLTSLVGCNVVQRTEESKGKTVLAKVDDVKITRDDVDAELYSTLSYYKSTYGDDFETNEDLVDTIKEERTSVIEYLINEQVILSKQKDLGVKYPKDELKADAEEQVQSFKDYYGDEETFNSFLEAYGFTEDSFFEYWKGKLLVNKIAEAMVADVTVSDKEIEEYYNENIANYQVNAGADVQHIVFTDTDTGLADAEAARALYLQGSTLEEIAEMDQFKDKCVVEDLGHQDFEDNTMLVEEFVEGYKNLPAGEISEPVKTSYGYHLILTSNINTETITRSLEDAKEEVQETVLDNKKNEEYLKKLEEYKKSMTIKTYDDRY